MVTMADPVANPSIKDLLSDPLWVPYSLQGDGGEAVGFLTSASCPS